MHITPNSSAAIEVVIGVPEFAQLGDAERIGVAVEVETGHRGEADAVVDVGPGLAGEDLDRVAERNQFAGEMSGVDPLPAAARVAPVDQKGDAQPTGARGSGGDAFGDRWGVDGPLTLCLLSPKLGMDNRSGQAHEVKYSPGQVLRRKPVHFGLVAGVRSGFPAGGRVHLALRHRGTTEGGAAYRLRPSSMALTSQQEHRHHQVATQQVHADQPTPRPGRTLQAG